MKEYKLISTGLKQDANGRSLEYDDVIAGANNIGEFDQQILENLNDLLQMAGVAIIPEEELSV